MVGWEPASVATPHGTQGLGCHASFLGRSDKAPQWGALTNSVSLSVWGQSPRPALEEPPPRCLQLRGRQASLTAACPCSLPLWSRGRRLTVFYKELVLGPRPTLTQGDLILIASGGPCIQIRSPP